MTKWSYGTNTMPQQWNRETEGKTFWRQHRTVAQAKDQGERSQGMDVM